VDDVILRIHLSLHYFNDLTHSRSRVIRNFIYLFVWDLESRADAAICRETSTGTARNERAGGAGRRRTQECEASKNKAPEIQTADRYLYIARKMRDAAKCPQITLF